MEFETVIGRKEINRIVPILLFLAMAAVLYTWVPAASEAAAQQQATDVQSVRVTQSNENKSVKKLIAMINKPTNPTELIKNIKYAVYNNLLMSDEITTDENLEKMFGSSKILWENNSPNYRRLVVADLAGVFLRGYTAAGVSYYCRRLDDKGMENAQGKLKIVISFSGQNDTRFTVEAVEEVFGTDMQVVNPYTRHNRSIALLRKTHPLGNMELIYNIESINSKTVVSFLTKGNGVIKKVKLTQEEK